MPNSRRLTLSGSDLTKDAFISAFPTIEHFLTSDEHSLNSRGLSQEEKEQVLLAPLQYLQEVAPEPVSGGDLFRSSDVLIFTGCTGIDTALEGGLRGRSITELTGGSGTGKTQICHMAAAAVAKNPAGGRAVYIDTSNSFSAKRLSQFFPGGLPTDPLLSNVTVFRPHGIYQVLAVVESLLVEISQPKGRGVCPSLIILDSVSSVISPILGSGGKLKHGHTLMVELGKALKLLALKFNLSVLCTNHDVGGSDDTRAALGVHWTNQVTVRLRFTKVHNDLYKATVVRAGDGKVGATFNFRLKPSHM